jgi:FkbM family methyltransferase
MAEVNNFIEFCNNVEYLGQNKQDAWILYETKNRTNGYFVDFGATDGKIINNTYILEANYDWSGIVAEPSPYWKNDLFLNRKCHISTDCVWVESGSTVDFLLTDAPDLATVKGFGINDEHATKRITNNIIKVKTISLFDLLERYEAPSNIDYLSIDTEGTEYGILNKFFRDNTKYTINYITIEHNYIQSYREQIFNLLSSLGYERKFTEVSACDDFYVRK